MDIYEIKNIHNVKDITKIIKPEYLSKFQIGISEETKDGQVKVKLIRTTKTIRLNDEAVFLNFEDNDIAQYSKTKTNFYVFNVFDCIVRTDDPDCDFDIQDKSIWFDLVKFEHPIISSKELRDKYNHERSINSNLEHIFIESFYKHYTTIADVSHSKDFYENILNAFISYTLEEEPDLELPNLDIQ